jgi:hypothetical protein
MVWGKQLDPRTNEARSGCVITTQIKAEIPLYNRLIAGGFR